MVTFLDVALVEVASPIFTMIFVWVVMFALMQIYKIPGDNKNLQAIIALMVSLFVLFTPPVTHLIQTISPWFVLMFILMLFMLIAVKMLGVGEGDIAHAVKGEEGRFILYFVIAFSLIIIAGSFGTTFGQDIGPYVDGDGNSTTVTTNTGTGSTDTGDFNKNLQATLFHPKVLGMILLLTIASFAIRMLTKGGVGGVIGGGGHH